MRNATSDENLIPQGLRGGRGGGRGSVEAMLFTSSLQIFATLEPEFSFLLPLPQSAMRVTRRPHYLTRSVPPEPSSAAVQKGATSSALWQMVPARVYLIGLVAARF